MNRFLDNVFVFILLMALYRFALDYVYIETIAPIFSYAKLTYEPDTFCQSVSLVAFVCGTILVLPYRKMQGVFVPQSMMILYLMVFVPMTSFWACKKQDVSFMVACLVFWIILLLAIRMAKGIDLTKYVKVSEKNVNIIVFIMSVVIIFISGYYAHFRMHFSLFDVYELRSEASTYNIPIIIDYIWSASANVLPMCIIYYFDKGRKKKAIFVTFVAFLNFSIAGLKSSLFKIFICIGLYCVGKKNVSKILPYIFILLVVVTILEFIITSNSILSILIIRRGFYMPNLLDEFYFDYISENGPIFYQPQKTNLAFTIGDTYFGNEEMRCNNGLFTDAFMNLGWIGVLFYPILFAYFFKTCERSFKYVNENSTLFAAFIITSTLRSSLFTTSVFTHGLFIAVFSMLFMSNRSERIVAVNRNKISK